MSDLLRPRAPDRGFSNQTRPMKDLPAVTPCMHMGSRRVNPLLSVLPLPLSAAGNSEEILETNARALPPDEPCSRSMHVKMHKRKQPSGMRRRDGRPLDIPLASFGNLQLDSGSAIPSWGGPLLCTRTHHQSRPSQKCLAVGNKVAGKPDLRSLLWQAGLPDTWTSSSTLGLGALLRFSPCQPCRGTAVWSPGNDAFVAWPARASCG